MKQISKTNYLIFKLFFSIFVFLVGINSKNKTRKEMIDYYENFNLTEELEKRFENDIYDGDKNEEYYKDIEDLDKHTSNNENEDREWETKIHTFLPQNLLTVNINKGDYSIFYEEIKIIPSNITIAFYVHDESSKIDLEIYNPENKLVHKVKGKNRAYHNFIGTKSGIYEFHLDNQRVSKFLFYNTYSLDNLEK